MDTKQRILDEALTLFSEKGYANVFVADIAERVGIKAPSLYKHYKNKQAIFYAIIEEMNRRFLEVAGALKINGADAAEKHVLHCQSAGQRTLVNGRRGAAFYFGFRFLPAERPERRPGGIISLLRQGPRHNQR